MRIVFAGTPDAAVPTLRALASSGHEIVAVVTRVDAPLGRRRVMTPSPVAAAAEDLGLPILKANRLDDAVTADIAALRPDLGVIVAYGGLVRRALLDTPREGWINLHFSSLPKWRGAAPVQRALMAGEQTLGAMVFRLVEALDAGDVYGGITEEVDGRTAGQMLQVLAESGAALTTSVVDGIAAGTAVAVAQEGEPTTAAKLVTDDGRLDWTEPSDRVLARFRGVTPDPGAFTETAGQRVKVIDLAPFAAGDDDVLPPPGGPAIVRRTAVVGTGDGAVALRTVQPAGRTAMDGAAWLRGIGDPAGVVFE